MRSGLVAAGTLTALAAACSSPEESGAPPATADERRALAKARAMIPPGEAPSAEPTATEAARP